ncbi:MAG: hypothetical protein IKG56_04005 [Clostridia bacterium]|nr:hypothetical protein [Clostridia bacterium]
MEINKRLKKMIRALRETKYMPYMVIILLGIVTTIPLFTMNLSEFNEFRIHIARVTSVKEIIQDGFFPPFINYKYMTGFGYALNIFYGSLTTYIPILISLVTTTNTIALKIFTLITVILSGTTMYMFVNKVTNKRTASLIAAMIYICAPYKLTDMYSRDAVGEYTSFIFIPMIFMGIIEIIDNNKNGDIWLIAGASLLILTHTITTIYTAIFVIMYLILNYKKLKRWEIWKNFILDIIAILMLTSFYTIPLIEHKIGGEYIIYDAEKMGATGADVYNNTTKPTQWFENEFSYKTESPYEDIKFSIGVSILVLSIITIFLARKVEEKYKDVYIIFLLLSIVSLFMCTKAFPWFIMPHIITIIQFAWRMNGFFVFFISIVCGINTYIFSESLHKNKYVAISMIVSVIFVIGILDVSKYITKYDSEIDKRFENALLNAEKIGIYYVNREYMPLKAGNNKEYIEERENRSYILEGNGKIKKEDKNKLYDSIEINDVENAKIELPYLYYKGYTTTLNGERIKNFESDNGFLMVEINDSGKIEVKYTGTIFEKIGFIISALSFIVITTIMVKRKNNYNS